jgi:hypothetical protein
MSFQGHLVCHTCKLKLSLGKLLRDDSGRHVGFGHAKFTDEELGRVAIAFVAVHIKHNLVAMGDTVLEQLEELPEFDSLVRVPPDSPYASKHAPVQYGGIDLWRLPCEPLSDREKRIANNQQP